MSWACRATVSISGTFPPLAAAAPPSSRRATSSRGCATSTGTTSPPASHRCRACSARETPSGSPGTSWPKSGGSALVHVPSVVVEGRPGQYPLEYDVEPLAPSRNEVGEGGQDDLEPSIAVHPTAGHRDPPPEGEGVRPVARPPGRFAG